MGKSKGGKGGKDPGAGGGGGKKGKGKAAVAPKCTCEHPFNCDCGNRPPRPTRGHKWDPETQQWGGKGHRQKGGSGQTSAIGQQAKTTSVGQTQVAQWQRLPSALLREVCQKQRRPPPKFKELLQDHKKTKFKVRCIVQDPKGDSDKDLFLVPAQPVGNEEQAKEEAALLALLQLTPKLPHERKLPEPYKTTWLTAVEALKQQQEAQTSSNKKLKDNSNTSGGGNSTNTNQNGTASGRGKASANTNLVLATTHISMADRRKQTEEKKRSRNARIRKHEAIRMANRNHPVFLSAKLRQMIQRLLQGEMIFDGPDPADDDENDESLQQYESDQQQYVEERLHHEGFTRRQSRKAFETLSPQVTKNQNNNGDEEDAWDILYDECLQWLCVHLPEDQLPEGFDPRGQTLEIVAAPSSGNRNKASTTTNTSSNALTPQQEGFSKKYGLSLGDAVWLDTQSAAASLSEEQILWTRITQLSSMTIPTSTETPDETSQQVLVDELEALEAMFPDGLKVSKDNQYTSIILESTPDDLSLKIVLEHATYPLTFPNRIVCTGTKALWIKEGVGVGFHVELAKCLFDLSLGEPMIFELYSHMQQLQQNMEEIPALTLSGQANNLQATTKSGSATEARSDTKKTQPRNNIRSTPRPKVRRPRGRGAFWSMHPSKIPSAEAFPKISKALELQRSGLPAGKARGDFLSILRDADKSSRVVLVTGDTGCGKTTQIPQFILEEAPKDAKIVVAQPRRLAATGVAGRVAQERGEEKPGTGSVGYVVRGDSAMCKSTRLLFCTFGILLRQLQCEGALDNITHIVIDEVHERNLDGDVLMALLKQCLSTTPNLRVVLMSATLDADRFAAYWGKNTPRMHIPGRTFPVNDFFLEDVLEMTNYNPPKKRKSNFYRGNGNQSQPRPRKQTAWDDSELSDREEDTEDSTVVELDKNLGNQSTPASHGNIVPLEEKLKRVDETRIDYDMLGQLVKFLVLRKEMGSDGSILVFLPGAPEINQAKAAVSKIAGSLPIKILPLHGGLQTREQLLVFQDSPRATKVILSTNVAETSITIPDCTVVIDGCREKQSSYDPTNRMPLLIEVFASKASLKQRRGRSGRVREGKCYKLISKATHAKLHDHTAPEITRCALDQTLLSLLFLGVEKGNGSFLSTLLDPPKQQSVDAATYSLQKLGALTEIGDNLLQLTPLGMHLAGIPAPPVVGKMLVMGSILGCRRAALAMAAGISTGRSPFLRVDIPRHKKGMDLSIEEMKQQVVLEERAKLFELSGNSDHAMLAAAFTNWEDLRQGGGERKKYCEKLGLSFTGMRDILQLVNQYDSALTSAGYGSTLESDRNAQSWRVLRTCAISAMAPGQLVRVHRPSTKYESTAEGAREKGGVAKELKFFIRPDAASVPADAKYKDERVFIHPSSALFAVGNYSCPWLVYHSMVKTSKPFLRDATECSAYALLLFGGNLEVEARNSIITVDGWVTLSANARIGALIRGLRSKMDDLLAKKIENPNIEIADSPEMRLIVTLLFTDGMGS